MSKWKNLLRSKTYSNMRKKCIHIQYTRHLQHKFNFEVSAEKNRSIELFTLFILKFINFPPNWRLHLEYCTIFISFLMRSQNKFFPPFYSHPSHIIQNCSKMPRSSKLRGEKSSLQLFFHLLATSIHTMYWIGRSQHSKLKTSWRNLD
jgi:hypothetical protein